MREKKIIVKKSVGAKSRPNNDYLYYEDEVFHVESNQFFDIYSDGSRKVRNIKFDYDDYTSDEYENIKENIAYNIARLRYKRGFSYEDIAWRVGVSRQYISQIENGDRNASLEVVSEIARVLGVNVEFLIRKKSFSSNNIYIDLLNAEIRSLEPSKQKELCALIIEKLWQENDN